MQKDKTTEVVSCLSGVGRGGSTATHDGCRGQKIEQKQRILTKDEAKLS